ncbi:uncharacterized protein LY89DRAFT_687170 [Mollisia scopiformis]|uniref:Uncharacterized protein n=1 Tax=Mollisia scopiformis TaxID=149040 RepID=A0A194X0V3_MOLSC|nr:uncharacterized protein LY89DRAFT_687170 [Mollisia scopiformis]KUJ13815.1 hypothetical protein LY89DRAFT_687170 [Mollisia scopiformis]
MNMSCSLVPALIIANNTWPDKLATVLEPLYTINSSYTSTVDGWISSFSKDPTAPPQVSIDFNVGNAAGETWSDLGHNDLDVNVSASRGCFFSATFKENNKITTSYVNASSNANDPQATITMQSFGTFPVTAGQWALNNLRSFPLLTNAPKDLKDPTYKVSQVCMAYGVGFTIKLSGETANQVDSYIQKVNKTGAGGSISIFGYEIGASVTSTSDSTQTWDDWYKTYKSGTITVKPSNNAVPTMIGALGVSV